MLGLEVLHNLQILFGRDFELSKNVTNDENRHSLVGWDDNRSDLVVTPVDAMAAGLPLEGTADGEDDFLEGFIGDGSEPAHQLADGTLTEMLSWPTRTGGCHCEWSLCDRFHP